MSTKTQILKELHIIVEALNKIDNEHGDGIFGVCNKFIRTLTNYFFICIDEETDSLGNGTLFTATKENTTLINILGQCILILMSIIPIVVQYMKFL